MSEKSRRADSHVIYGVVTEKEFLGRFGGKMPGNSILLNSPGRMLVETARRMMGDDQIRLHAVMRAAV